MFCDVLQLNYIENIFRKISLRHFDDFYILTYLDSSPSLWVSLDNDEDLGTM